MHHETPSETIAKLLYTYAERIDVGDFAGVAEVFAHATLTFEGFPQVVSGAPAVASSSTNGPPGDTKTGRPARST